MSERTILFEGKVTDTSSSWELSLSIVSTVLLAIITIIAFTDVRLGGPLFYLPFLLLSIGATYWMIRRTTATVRLVRDLHGDYTIEVKGIRHNVVMPLDGDYSFWYSHERTKMRHGGYVMTRYNLLISGRGGARLGFRMEAGRAGGEPESWLHREEYLHNGRDIFQMMNLIALLRALEEANLQR